MDKVSIIIPVYNAFNTIDKCIKSILNQSYNNIELILINDGSKDESLKKIEDYKKKYSNIIILDKINEGVAKTRNLGIKKATGKYIMFIDNDDYIDDDLVEKFVSKMKKSDCDVLIGGYRRENNKGKIIKKVKLKDGEWSKYIIMAPWAKLFKRDFLIKNNIEFLNFPIGEDVYFNLSIYSIGAKIKTFDYSGYVWFYNDNSVSNTKQKGMNKNINIIEFLNKINSFYNNKKSSKLISYFFYKYCIWYLLFSGKNATKTIFVKNYRLYMQWLKKNGYYKTISPFSAELTGECLKDRLAVFAFKIINFLNLEKIFSFIYCKG